MGDFNKTDAIACGNFAKLDAAKTEDGNKSADCFN
jgi:hypothetical protein